ncbi:MAG: hypothetical protein HY265_06055, partial [Deltaproteobacteria bacterium]|nr:hypothetical protein [Deltaproteobacteria bacterium]
KLLSEVVGRIKEADRQAVRDALKILKDAIEGSNTAAIKAATDRLFQASTKLTEGM